MEFTISLNGHAAFSRSERDVSPAHTYLAGTMESLLSVSFDNIASRESSKIRKGLRQIEGLLAQICLSKSSSRSPHKRKSSVLSDKQAASPKKLRELQSDPAFREFFRLQEGFQWNGTNTKHRPSDTMLILYSCISACVDFGATDGDGKSVANRLINHIHA